MKRLLKIGGALVGVILLLALSFIAYIWLAPYPTYTPKDITLNVVVDSTKLAEGEKIVKTLCSHCHMSADGKLGGNEMKDAGAFGEIHSSNITKDPEYGALSKYSDGELAYLIRTGIKRDGSYAPPWMVKLPHLSDEDMESIIVYLRSSAPELEPSNRPSKPSKLNFLAKMLIKTGAFSPLSYPEGPVSAPNPNDKIAYGEYLALSKYDCFACHSSAFSTCDFQNPKNSDGFLGGGNPIPNLAGDIILSANLTMDEETGLGSWTEEAFIRCMKSGIRPDKIAVRYPMIPYTRLNEEEISAIWAYLNTVPVIHNPDDFTPDMD